MIDPCALVILERFRQNEAEPRTEYVHVVTVVIVRLVGEMAAELQPWCQAGERSPGDCPNASETFRRIAEGVSFRLLLETTAVAVEGNEMYVNLPIRGVTEDTPRRQLVYSKRKSQAAQGILCVIELRHCHHNIQIIMWACLATDQCINAPAAIEPDHTTGLFEAFQDFQHIYCAHHGNNLTH